MTDDFIDRSTTTLWKLVVIERRWICTTLNCSFMHNFINLVTERYMHMIYYENQSLNQETYIKIYTKLTLLYLVSQLCLLNPVPRVHIYHFFSSFQSLQVSLFQLPMEIMLVDSLEYHQAVFKYIHFMSMKHNQCECIIILQYTYTISMVMYHAYNTQHNTK